MNDKIIFHLSKKTWWEKQRDLDVYHSENFHEEKFIHGSTRAQLHTSANTYYGHEPSIILLHIDTEQLTAELKYELSPSRQQFFPHIYGPINKEAILTVEELHKNPGDTWNI